MLLQRVLSAMIGIPVALVVIYVGGVWFTLAILMLSYVALWEFYLTLGSKDIEVIKEVAYPCLTALTIGAGFLKPTELFLLWQAVFFVLIVGSLAFHIWHRRRDETAALRPSGWRTFSAAATGFGTIYIGVLFSFSILLRNFGDGTVVLSGLSLRMHEGACLFLLVLLSTWSLDAAAYFIGKTVGRRRLAPQISPAKSVQGSIGGFLAAVLMATLLACWFHWVWWHGLVIGALMGVVGQIGDLCKSVIKRDLGVKDFGTLIPGHGGVLDRFDGIMVNAPLVYFFALTVLH